ncbi:NAD(P)-binding protein [Cryphonectria parasitica EP155]|uniref:NAD(P)-binding protein n=1 Tax=Cryphonectria parasitica (strain ATCC 38755 / EP155) TaxID=660469 RepID=A0A9P5CLB8_CRYP1|nr:NAD(P)-binding protein [Cryphonectria parasitica EP155]KAF3762903.1 NAD(P)-binding protein [Cryphonectria parasitica EP155]
MASKYNKLQGKHVLIIGGTSGIGYAVAEASLAAGAKVTVSSSSQARVESTVQKLKENFPNGTAAGHACDVSKPTVEQDLEALFTKVGQVDHIVYTAGGKLSQLDLPDVTYEKLIAAGQIRFFAAFFAAKVGRKFLTPGPYSSIVFTTGTVSQKPIPGWSALAGYGGGLHALTRNLALDLKPIRVNLVSPGAVETELWETGNKEADEKLKAMLDGVVKTLPTGRIAQPEDVAEAYLFLLKDPSVTGTVVDSNSGALLV